MHNKENSILHYTLIIIICFFAFFINNRVIPADLMESRNLATAQEMVHTGNYLIPTMNGELRLEKPPLPTWIAAGVEHISPDNLTAQRYVAGAFATFMVFFLYLLVRRLASNGLVALLSAIVLASSFNVILMGRTATWDIYCHSFMLGAIYFLVIALENQGKQWRYFITAGLFMGLSFLSKGPVSFFALLLPFLISYGIIVRPRMRDKFLPLMAMIGLTLVVSFWWPVYITLFHPETGLAVAGKESTAWISHNVRPFWYYWKFPAEAGVWAFFWVTSLVYFFWKRDSEKRQTYKLSIVWTLLALILLSCIPEKKTRYLLPLLIPGAVNIAFYIYNSAFKMSKRSEKVVFQINGTIIGVIALLLPLALYFIPDIQSPTWLIIVTTTLCLIISISIVTVLFNKRKTVQVLAFFSLTTLLMIVFESFFLFSAGKIFINEQRHSIHMLRKHPEVQGLPFYHYDQEFLRMELVYEANQIIRPMDIENNNLIEASVPFVFVSTASIDSLFKGKAVIIEHIDNFDNNWRKTTDKRYNKDMVKEVAIIRHTTKESPVAP